jgi:hypothetical protein
MQLKVNISYKQGVASLSSKETSLTFEQIKYELAYCNVRYNVMDKVISVTRPYIYETKEEAERVCKQIYRVALGNFNEVSFD